MRAKCFYIILFFSAVQTLAAQRKMYQLGSIRYFDNTPSSKNQTMSHFQYRLDDSMSMITYFIYDTLQKKYNPSARTIINDINSSLYYYSSYQWDIVSSIFRRTDSFKVVNKMYSTISFDTTYILVGSDWQIGTVRTKWHNPDFYPSLKSNDSIKLYRFPANHAEQSYYYKFDEFGRDTLFTEINTNFNLHMIYKKEYDDSNRLKTMYYALKNGKYYLKENLHYDSKNNLSKVDFISGLHTQNPRYGSYVPFKYHDVIKIKECNLNYNYAHYGQPFISAPIEEFLPWDSTEIHYEKTLYFYSKTKAYSQVNNIEKSKLTIYPNPSKGNLRHTSLEPLRLYFYTLDGRKIEETRLEPNTDFRLRNHSHNLLLVEAYNLKGEKLFAEKLVLE